MCSPEIGAEEDDGSERGPLVLLVLLVLLLLLLREGSSKEVGAK
jgi:hypothetical protein